LVGFGQLISRRVGTGDARLLAREGDEKAFIFAEDMPEKGFGLGDFL
jgi:hypothetical protein